MGTSIPKTSVVCHKRKSGHITITCVLFLTILQLDVRHQTLQHQPREPLWRLTENGMLVPSCTHYGHLAIPQWKANIISNVSSNDGCLEQIKQDLNSVHSYEHVEQPLPSQTNVVISVQWMMDSVLQFGICVYAAWSTAQMEPTDSISKEGKKTGKGRMLAVQNPIDSRLITNAATPAFRS